MSRLNNERYFKQSRFPFFTHVYPIEPGSSIGDHSHDFIELAYVVEGAGEHRYNGGAYYEIRPGDVFVIEPDIEHAYRVSERQRLVICNVLFLPALLKAELDTMSSVSSFVDFFYVEPLLRNDVHFQSRLTLPPAKQLAMKKLLDSLAEEHAERSPGYEIIIKTTMIQLFVFLSRCYQQSVVPVKRTARDETSMHSAVEFVGRHYAQPLSLEQISRICGMSASAFSVKFRQHTGKSLIEYRNELRIEAAERALADTNDLIAAIAQDAGFDDLSFFNKQFKKKTGLSPGQYRKQCLRSEIVGEP
ncbi:AraC family transcriptional regulator [Paenibacillus hodogayensis]|uniref:AraC family transcriptional regulator n=1 Tax=Paenibacillus hodogayensis TaxID=279208 RepID=A0ABV5VYK8_9BACL